MAITPAEMVQKWKTKVQSSGAAYAAGVQNTSVNPMQLAVAQQAKLLANFTASVNGGRWASRLNATPVAYWKSQANLAQNKYAMGATTGEAKYAAFATRAQPVYAQMRQASQAAGSDPYAKVVAALQVLIQAGSRSGGTAFN